VHDAELAYRDELRRAPQVDRMLVDEFEGEGRPRSGFLKVTGP
jgi:hypothetical protein